MNAREIHQIWNEQWKSAELRVHGKYRFSEIAYEFRNHDREWNKNDLTAFKEYLTNDDTKWFVANFFAIQKGIPSALFEPLIDAAISEPNPSANQDFINPCLRVFGFRKVFELLDDRFQSGNDQTKIGVCKAYYWARSPLVQVVQGTSSQLKGYKTKWNGHYYGDYDWDKGVHFEMTKEEVAECKKISDKLIAKRRELLLSEFLKNKSIDVRYQIKIALPERIEAFSNENDELAIAYFKELNRSFIPNNWRDLNLKKRLGFLGDFSLLQFLFKERKTSKSKDNLICRK